MMLSVWILMNEETDLLTMEIETGGAAPKNQAATYGASGIAVLLQFCGHTATHHMRPQVKNPPFFYSVMTVKLHPKRPCCPQVHWTQQLSLTTESM